MIGVPSSTMMMMLQSLALWVSIICLASAAPSGKSATQGSWTYQGLHGPRSWASEFPECGGTQQSPVDIQSDACQYDPNLNTVPLQMVNFERFSTMGSAGEGTILANFTNNGHSANVFVKGDMYVYGGGLPGNFQTAGFHFHWGSNSWVGSEHAIGGVKFPLEMHIVNFNVKYGTLKNAIDKRDGLAVLAVVFELSRQDNPAFAPLASTLHYIRKTGQFQLVEGINLRQLLPADTSRYYRYAGSLTTPGCYESVTWTIFAQPQKISENQMASLRNLEYLNGPMTSAASNIGQNVPGQLIDNWRPLQPLHGRIITQNFPDVGTHNHPTGGDAIPPPTQPPTPGRDDDDGVPVAMRDNSVLLLSNDNTVATAARYRGSVNTNTRILIGNGNSLYESPASAIPYYGTQNNANAFYAAPANGYQYYSTPSPTPRNGNPSNSWGGSPFSWNPQPTATDTRRRIID